MSAIYSWKQQNKYCDHIKMLKLGGDMNVVGLAGLWAAVNEIIEIMERIENHLLNKEEVRS